MNAVEDFVILGVYSGDRMTEYTKPGYERYARSLVEEVVPEVERRGIRVGRHRRHRSVWGSSLGGVVSFYTVWQHPDVFGSAVCMSSTFSHRDDLVDRVFAEPFRDVGFYLDSGWPGDNYEVTVGMAMALISRGWEYGHNLLHLCFPNADHSEASWGMRLAPAPAVPERRGGAGLPRQQAGPGRSSVRERRRLAGSTGGPIPMNEPRADLPRTVLSVLSLLLLIVASLWILGPFLVAIVWATLIAVATWPLMRSLERLLWGKRKLAVAVMTIALLAIVMVPLLAGVGRRREERRRASPGSRRSCRRTSSRPRPPGWRKFRSSARRRRTAGTTARRSASRRSSRRPRPT